MVKKYKVYLGKITLHFFLVIFAICILIPFYWMIMSSFKSTGDYYSKMTGLFVKNPVLDNYIDLFTKHDTVRWFMNSFIISILTTGIGLFICSLAGFAFGIYNFKFKPLLFWIVLGSVAIPDVVTITPIFKMMVDIKLIDTYASVVLPYAVSMFGIFMMKQYVSSSLPNDLLEAARIDGLTEAGIFVKIALPLIRPALGVLGIYLWLNSWIGYFWPFIMLKSKHMMTLQVGFATLYADPYNLQYGLLMAGSFLSTLPIIIIFLLAQEQFITGLTTGAVKG
ncbi:MAG: carbohydrate ABC transporter permease [Bacillota bacterium]